MNSQEMDMMLETLFDLRGQYKIADDARKELLAQVDDLENRILDALENMDKVNWESASCKVSVSHRSSVTVPKDLESKRQLFQYLREKGMFDELVSVNSNTLNSFYKEQNLQALDAGDVSFELPGCGKATIKKTLQVRAR